MVRTNLVVLVALVALVVVEQAVAIPQREAVAQEYLDKEIVVAQELGHLLSLEEVEVVLALYLRLVLLMVTEAQE